MNPVSLWSFKTTMDYMFIWEDIVFADLQTAKRGTERKYRISSGRSRSAYRMNKLARSDC